MFPAEVRLVQAVLLGRGAVRPRHSRHLRMRLRLPHQPVQIQRHDADAGQGRADISCSLTLNEWYVQLCNCS